MQTPSEYKDDSRQHGKANGETCMKSIRIQNLRNLKDTGEIDISPITVLVGQKQFRKEYLSQDISSAQTVNHPEDRWTNPMGWRHKRLCGFWKLWRICPFRQRFHHLDIYIGYRSFSKTIGKIFVLSQTSIHEFYISSDSRCGILHCGKAC